MFSIAANSGARLLDQINAKRARITRERGSEKVVIAA